MQTLREVLEPFAGRTLNSELIARMREVVEEWGNETGHIVYPISVDPPAGLAEEHGAVTFDVTFECVPKT